MVEFVLLFALGFLTAILLGLFTAPAIHGRIVKLTERRLQATVPMSRAELQAGRDMERAAYAAENRRVETTLKSEREKRVEAVKRADRLQDTAARMRGEIAELVNQIETMAAASADLRSELRQKVRQSDTMTLALSDAERAMIDRERHVTEGQQEIRRLSIDLEDMRVDLATRDTETESLKSNIETISEERRRLRDEVRHTAARAKDYQYRLEREEERSANLEERLAGAVAQLSDHESSLERRKAEVERLKQKLKTATSDMRSAESTLREFRDGHHRDAPAANEKTTMNGHSADIADSNEAGPDHAPQETADRGAISQRVEKLRQRHTALVDRLVAAEDNKGDQALRSEIKEIAASMITLTAAREGSASPIHSILANDSGGDDVSDQHLPSLAARAAEMMRENP